MHITYNIKLRGACWLSNSGPRWGESLLSLPKKWLSTQVYGTDDEDFQYVQVAKLPVPELQPTLDSYLQFASVIVSQQQLEKTQELVKRFAEDLGPKMQAKLVERQKEMINWHNSDIVNEDEFYEELTKSNLVDIHIIDSILTNNYERIGTVEKCQLYSLFIFLIDNERKNSMKIFKLFRVKGLVKIYMDIMTRQDLSNFPDQCCNKTLLTSCESRIYLQYNAEQKNIKSYENIISKIKNLINLYNTKINRTLRKSVYRNSFEGQYSSDDIYGDPNIFSWIDTGISKAAISSTNRIRTKVGKGYLLDSREYSLKNRISLPYDFRSTKSHNEEIRNVHTSYTLNNRVEEHKEAIVLENKKVISGEKPKDLLTDKTFFDHQSNNISTCIKKNSFNISKLHDTLFNKTRFSGYDTAVQATVKDTEPLNLEMVETVTENNEKVSVTSKLTTAILQKLEEVTITSSVFKDGEKYTQHNRIHPNSINTSLLTPILAQSQTKHTLPRPAIQYHNSKAVIKKHVNNKSDQTQNINLSENTINRFSLSQHNVIMNTLQPSLKLSTFSTKRNQISTNKRSSILNNNTKTNTKYTDKQLERNINKNENVNDKKLILFRNFTKTNKDFTAQRELNKMEEISKWTTTAQVSKNKLYSNFKNYSASDKYLQHTFISSKRVPFTGLRLFTKTPNQSNREYTSQPNHFLLISTITPSLPNKTSESIISLYTNNQTQLINRSRANMFLTKSSLGKINHITKTFKINPKDNSIITQTDKILTQNNSISVSTSKYLLIKHNSSHLGSKISWSQNKIDYKNEKSRIPTTIPEQISEISSTISSVNNIEITNTTNKTELNLLQLAQSVYLENHTTELPSFKNKTDIKLQTVRVSQTAWPDLSTILYITPQPKVTDVKYNNVRMLPILCKSKVGKINQRNLEDMKNFEQVSKTYISTSAAYEKLTLRHKISDENKAKPDYATQNAFQIFYQEEGQSSTRTSILNTNKNKKEELMNNIAIERNTVNITRMPKVTISNNVKVNLAKQTKILNIKQFKGLPTTSSQIACTLRKPGNLTNNTIPHKGKFVTALIQSKITNNSNKQNKIKLKTLITPQMPVGSNISYKVNEFTTLSKINKKNESGVNLNTFVPPLTQNIATKIENKCANVTNMTSNLIETQKNSNNAFEIDHQPIVKPHRTTQINILFEKRNTKSKFLYKPETSMRNSEIGNTNNKQLKITNILQDALRNRMRHLKMQSQYTKTIPLLRKNDKESSQVISQQGIGFKSTIIDQKLKVTDIKVQDMRMLQILSKWVGGNYQENLMNMNKFNQYSTVSYTIGFPVTTKTEIIPETAKLHVSQIFNRNTAENQSSTGNSIVNTNEINKTIDKHKINITEKDNKNKIQFISNNDASKYIKTSALTTNQLVKGKHLNRSIYTTINSHSRLSKAFQSTTTTSYRKIFLRTPTKLLKTTFKFKTNNLANPQTESLMLNQVTKKVGQIEFLDTDKSKETPTTLTSQRVANSGKPDYLTLDKSPHKHQNVTTTIQLTNSKKKTGNENKMKEESLLTPLVTDVSVITNKLIGITIPMVTEVDEIQINQNKFEPLLTSYITIKTENKSSNLLNVTSNLDDINNVSKKETMKPQKYSSTQINILNVIRKPKWESMLPYKPLESSVNNLRNGHIERDKIATGSSQHEIETENLPTLHVNEVTPFPYKINETHEIQLPGIPSLTTIHHHITPKLKTHSKMKSFLTVVNSPANMVALKTSVNTEEARTLYTPNTKTLSGPTTVEYRFKASTIPESMQSYRTFVTPVPNKYKSYPSMIDESENESSQVLSIKDNKKTTKVVLLRPNFLTAQENNHKRAKYLSRNFINDVSLQSSTHSLRIFEKIKNPPSLDVTLKEPSNTRTLSSMTFSHNIFKPTIVISANNDTDHEYVTKPRILKTSKIATSLSHFEHLHEISKQLFGRVTQHYYNKITFNDTYQFQKSSEIKLTSPPQDHNFPPTPMSITVLEASRILSIKGRDYKTDTKLTTTSKMTRQNKKTDNFKIIPNQVVNLSGYFNFPKDVTTTKHATQIQTFPLSKQNKSSSVIPNQSKIRNLIFLPNIQNLQKSNNCNDSLDSSYKIKQEKFINSSLLPTHVLLRTSIQPTSLLLKKDLKNYPLLSTNISMAHKYTLQNNCKVIDYSEKGTEGMTTITSSLSSTRNACNNPRQGKIAIREIGIENKENKKSSLTTSSSSRKPNINIYTNFKESSSVIYENLTEQNKIKRKNGTMVASNIHKNNNITKKTPNKIAINELLSIYSSNKLMLNNKIDTATNEIEITTQDIFKSKQSLAPKKRPTMTTTCIRNTSICYSKFINAVAEKINMSTQTLKKYVTAYTLQDDYLKKDNDLFTKPEESFSLSPKVTNSTIINNYYVSLPNNTIANKIIHSEEKSIKKKNTAGCHTISIARNIFTNVNGVILNNLVLNKRQQSISANTTTGFIPEIAFSGNLTNLKNTNQNGSTITCNLLKLNKNYQESKKEYKENRTTPKNLVQKIIVNKLFESKVTIKLNGKTIKYNTYKPKGDDYEVSMKPYIISNYKSAKQRKFNVLSTILPNQKMKKTLPILKKKNDIFHHLKNETVHSKKTKSKPPSKINQINFKKKGNKRRLLTSFEKTNLYPLTKFPSKAHRKVMKRIHLPNNSKKIIAMDTTDLLISRHLATKSMIKVIYTHKAPISHPLQNIVTVNPKHRIIHPIIDKVDGIIKPSQKYFKPKPIFYDNEDFYRNKIITHHQNDALSLRKKVNHIKASFPISNSNDPANFVIDRPMYLLPSNTKPKLLRDRIDSIRNYVYNAENILPTQGTTKRVLESTIKDEGPYIDPLYYFRRSGWYDDYVEGRTPTTTTTRKPTKRQRRTIFFLSPTVTDWWLDDMYLKVRLPLPINSNPGMVFPRRQFAKIDEVADLAALYIDDLLDYKEMLDRGELPQERATSREKGQPLCMEQFYRLLGVCRIPEVGKDRLELPTRPNEATESEELVIVACRNYFYPIPVKAGDRGRLTPGEMQAQLLHAMVDAAGAPPAPRVGILTTMNRDQWAKSREQLIRDENNRANLELISRALCIMCIDEAGGDRPELDSDTNALLRAMHGGGTRHHSANRWFDKTVQLIISSDGTVGMCYEHSPAEGVAVIRLAERALARAEVADRPSPPPVLLPAPQPMKWNLTVDLQRTIEHAARDFDRAISNLDLRVYTYRNYGREFMKSCRTSPDVYIQLAMQYAYYKLYGYLVSTYESASLRRFNNGRVDNIRSAHSAAHAWASAMCTADTPPQSEEDGQRKVSFNLYGEQKKLELFEEAARKQTVIMEANILGRGIDNHLLGLREAARETLGELPELFTDPTYGRMIEFKLSTSQVATTTDGTFMGYGAVVPDGYGCSYNPKKDCVIFCISSFIASSVTNTEAFRQSLEEALDSMKLMFQNKKTES
ncbi:jg4591 [Pararge aegeria aegeria]|uniref:Choline O-acetyltransferase n=1 Tax=Pararge aegeria aegeria TaxID=348720 RepID=A0A8S4RRP6_9NEOP|nr:jg4591 [Pararge aegeria aegeria]